MISKIHNFQKCQKILGDTTLTQKRSNSQKLLSSNLSADTKEGNDNLNTNVATTEIINIKPLKTSEHNSVEDDGKAALNTISMKSTSLGIIYIFLEIFIGCNLPAQTKIAGTENLILDTAAAVATDNFIDDCKTSDDDDNSEETSLADSTIDDFTDDDVPIQSAKRQKQDAKCVEIECERKKRSKINLTENLSSSTLIMANSERESEETLDQENLLKLLKSWNTPEEILLLFDGILLQLHYIH